MIFLVVGDNGLGNSHSHSHNLTGGTTTLNSNSNGEIFEFITSKKEDWLENLGSHGLWLDEVEWLSINSDESMSLLAESNGGGVLLLTEGSDLLFLSITHYFFDIMHKLAIVLVT